MMSEHISFEQMYDAAFTNAYDLDKLDELTKVQSHILKCKQCREQFETIAKFRNLVEQRSMEKSTADNEAIIVDSRRVIRTVLKVAELARLSREYVNNWIQNIIDNYNDRVFNIKLSSQGLDIINNASFIHAPRAMYAMGENGERPVKESPTIVNNSELKLNIEYYDNKELIITGENLEEGSFIILEGEKLVKISKISRIPNTENMYGAIFENINQNDNYKIII